MEGIVGNRQYAVDTKEFIVWFDGYLAGLRYGKTMAEVDAHYNALLSEIKELQKRLVEHKSCQQNHINGDG